MDGINVVKFLILFGKEGLFCIIHCGYDNKYRTVSGRIVNSLVIVRLSGDQNWAFSNRRT